MLFRAPGTSHVKGLATPVNLSGELRTDSEEGFNLAAKEMIANLDEQLVAFREKIKTAPEEYKVVRSAGYSGGGGSFDGWTLLVLLFLIGGLKAGQWRKSRCAERTPQA
jgi:rhombotail lipoprotein